MVYTVRLAGQGRQGGRTKLETELRRLGIIQKNGKPPRALPHRATPATIYTIGTTATPTTDRTTDTHDRVRTDRIDKTGAVALRAHGKLHHIGVGRTHARTPVKLLIHDLNVTIIHAATGEILRELTINPDKDYQPTDKTTQKRN